jgi:hypothetical protein
MVQPRFPNQYRSVRQKLPKNAQKLAGFAQALLIPRLVAARTGQGVAGGHAQTPRLHGSARPAARALLISQHDRRAIRGWDVLAGREKIRLSEARGPSGIRLGIPAA